MQSAFNFCFVFLIFIAMGFFLFWNKNLKKFRFYRKTKEKNLTQAPTDTKESSYYISKNLKQFLHGGNMTDSEMELEVTVLHGIVWEVSNMVDQ